MDPIAYGAANASIVLRRLEEVGLVELVLGGRPPRWKVTGFGRSRAERLLSALDATDA